MVFQVFLLSLCSLNKLNRKMDSNQRREVVELTRRMIISQGVKSVRMDDVAHAARVSKRTLYEEFNDKDELLFQAVKLHFDSLDYANAELARKMPNILLAILAIMDSVKVSASVNWRIRNSLKKFYPHLNQRLQDDRAKEKLRTIVYALKLGVKQGYIHHRVKPELALAILNYISTAIIENDESISIPEGITIDEAFESMFINYLRGISTSEGVKIIDDYINEREKQMNK